MGPTLSKSGPGHGNNRRDFRELIINEVERSVVLVSVFMAHDFINDCAKIV